MRESVQDERTRPVSTRRHVASSSGRSANILNGVDVARARGCGVITYSGFGADNPLRRGGDVNFYIRSGEYGFVEVAHLALCHASFDIAMGWSGDA